MSDTKKKYFLPICVLMVGILVLFLILHLERINLWLGYWMYVLRAPLIGLVIAYLCNPIFRMFERKCFVKINAYSFRRLLSLICTYLVLLLILVTLVLLIVPQLVASILDFLGSYESYLQTAVSGINDFLTFANNSFSLNVPLLQHSAIQSSITEFLSNLELQSFLEGMLTYSNLTKLFAAIGDAFFTFMDVILGLFISFYLLNYKEKHYAQVMRFRKAIFSDSFNEHITAICSVADKSFGGFFRGKLLDSTLVGILVYIIISIMNVPYSLLIAVVIGITDIVPVVGPFVGVIPSAVIILLTDPIKVIPFLLCILIVQQIDGNIIAPKILGDNTGVSSLCVMIAITIMGAIWGLVGMVLGVPLFATILELGSRYLDKRIRQKKIDEREKIGIDEDTAPNEAYTAKPNITISGTGSFTTEEEHLLTAYRLAKKHNIQNDTDNEAIAEFAKEYAMEIQHREQQELETFGENIISNMEAL